MLLVVAVFYAAVANAQVTTSGMNGQVTDGKEPLIGATVHAVHVPSGTSYMATTNEKGRFAIQGMRTGGPYKVTIS